MKHLLITLRAVDHAQARARMAELEAADLVDIDSEYPPVRLPPRTKRPETPRKRAPEEQTALFVIRGQLREGDIAALEKIPFIDRVRIDTRIAPFFCFCNTLRKGTLDDVATCIGAKQLWARGVEGAGVVVGIVDGGVDATKFPNLLDGSSPDWGANVQWDEHGNMCSQDCTGVAPSVGLYDLRIAGPDSISSAIQAYDWALARFAADGTPHILSNSWGIYQESWDPDYATDPDHPFTVMVEGAIAAGIRVLFAAGNCGKPCGKRKYCRRDRGPGRSIWGANGHPEVMTVGAVKLNNVRLKYSSQGPAALHPDKPDFCGYSSFKGYFRKDGGTSAACPVVAGASALLVSHNPALGQPQLLALLRATAKDIEAVGFDTNTGAGVVRVDEAYYDLNPADRPASDFRDKLCDYIYRYERLCTKWADEGSQQCSQWADQGSNECAQWADQGSNQCSQWADEGSSQCCTWWPCSWGCKALYWVAKWVCKAWYWVANWVCQAWYWVANWVCQAWYWVANWVCKAWVWVLQLVTVTNCTCR